jgi:hypothetical protein
VKYAIAGAVVVLVLWGWLSAFAYFDPLAFCRIHIDVELLEGDRSPIRRAINLVRREDPLAYHALCGYVDRIVEEPRCQAGDPQADPAQRGQPIARTRLDPALARALDAPGCYVRGSRIVILKRSAATDEASVRERADTLKRLAGYSRAFWADRILAR